MAGLPWYLLAAGIVLVVFGALLTGLGGPGGGRTIDPRMKDEDIARSLNHGGGNLAANVLVLLGLICIAVSVVWRIVRAII